MSKYRVQDVFNYNQIFFLDKFLVGHNGYIAGGCFKNIFNGEPVRDIDLFFETQEDFLKAKQYYEKQIEEHPEEWRFSYKNNNCWAVYSIKDKIRLELISKVFRRPEELLREFDFTITKFAYYKNYENQDDDNYLAVFEVIYHEDFFEDLQMKRLVIDEELLYPVNSFNRVLKYTKYGYNICRESKVKLLLSITNFMATENINESNAFELSAILGNSYFGKLILRKDRLNEEKQ